MRISTPGSILRPRQTVRHRRIPTDQQAFEICKAMSFVLDTVYPGYIWQVGMIQDLVCIQNMSLNKEYAWQRPLSDFDTEGKMLVRLGGEILERFNMRRGKRVQAEFRALKRDIKHNATPEL